MTGRPGMNTALHTRSRHGFSWLSPIQASVGWGRGSIYFQLQQAVRFNPLIDAIVKAWLTMQLVHGEVEVTVSANREGVRP